MIVGPKRIFLTVKFGCQNHIENARQQYSLEFSILSNVNFIKFYLASTLLLLAENFLKLLENLPFLHP